MDKSSVARIIALLGSLLAYFGINIPSNVQEAVVAIIVAVVTLYSAYKNNYLFTKGKKQAQELDKKGLK